jgi:hypothetical protein
MNLDEFHALSREQQREVFRTLSAEDQRTIMGDMNRQIEARMRASLDAIIYHEELESQLVPRIAFKSTPTPEPLDVPLREGISQEDHVRRIFRSDVGIKEVRCADGNIYVRK